jgi:hypothetical protein
VAHDYKFSYSGGRDPEAILGKKLARQPSESIPGIPVSLAICEAYIGGSQYRLAQAKMQDPTEKQTEQKCLGDVTQLVQYLSSKCKA